MEKEDPNAISLQETMGDGPNLMGELREVVNNWDFIVDLVGISGGSHNGIK